MITHQQQIYNLMKIYSGSSIYCSETPNKLTKMLLFLCNIDQAQIGK